MSVIGIDPKRDKRAHAIIYGVVPGCSTLLNFFGGCMGVPPNIKAISNRQIKACQDKAWKIYTETGDIKKAIKIFFWNP